MKENIFIKRPAMAISISVMLLIVGVVSLVSLPVEQYPDIAPPTVQVSATYTGASADAVQKSVVIPLEESINGVENMLYMTSTASNQGQATITVYFKQGTNPDMAAVNVQNRVSKAQGLLPAEVTRVGVTTQKQQNSLLYIPILYSPDGRYDKQFLDNYMDINIIPRLKRINGVADVLFFGNVYSLRIWLKPDVMAQYGLVPSDITEVLDEQNIESPTGAFGENSGNTFQYTMSYKGRLSDVSEFENMVIRSFPDGNVLRVGDVAVVELGWQAYTYESVMNGLPSCPIRLFQVAGANATEVNNEISATLDEISKNLPEGMEIATILNSNEFLFASIHEVVLTLVIAIVLVVLVVYFFLHDFKSTLIPSLSILVSLIGTFAFLAIAGFSVNLLTLFALVLAIGTVVDDAIVVVEGVHAKLDQGYKSSREASIDAMSELGGAIVSITLVMMSVFIPVSFMGGTAGTFYRQFGITMAIAIGFSALNALTLSPALCAIFLKPHDEGHGAKKMTRVERFHTAFNAAYDSILKKYKKHVVFFIHKKWLSFGLVAASIILLVFFMKVTPTGMVPNEDTGTIMGAVTLPPGTSQERAMEILNRVDSLVAAEPAVDSRTVISGFGFIGGQGPSYGSIIIKLKDWEERSMMQNSDVVVGTLFMRAQKIIKDAQVLFFAPPMIPGYSASSDIELNMQDKTGGDLNHFYDVILNYMDALKARPEINSAQTTFNPNFPQYMLDIDAAACKKAGISPNDILTTMQGYFGGLYASNFNRFGKMYRVMIQAEPEATKNLESLNSIKIRNGNEMAPISQFVSIKKVYGPDVISRFNLYTSIKVMVAPASGYTSGQALQAIAEVAKENLPAGYGYELGGMAREEASTSGSSTGIIFILCFVFVYLLLSAQYESYILPLSVLLSVPFGLLGSFLFVNGFAALGSIPALKMILGTMSNDIYMQIALIMLMGLLAKNAILIVEFALDRRKQGMSISWAAVLGAAARLRPILMTSLAMIVGLIPLMLAMGVGAHGNRTLGASAIGGMLIGMIFQIFIVPVLFVVFQWLQEKFKPIEWENVDDTEVEPEIEQYTRK